MATSPHLLQSGDRSRTTGAVALIDLSALRHNFRRVREFAPESKVLAVVKADAYGHGLIDCARTLSDADGFAVARLGEAERLRAARIAHRIVLLPGIHDSDELARAIAADIDVVVHSEHQIVLLEEANTTSRVRVWVKVDSGMHRLGFAPAAVAAAAARLRAVRCVAQPMEFMTHLADGERTDLGVTTAQIERFNAATAGLPGARSIGNSAGILAWPAARSEWVRPGIMLYGVSPFGGETGRERGLRPVMTLRSRMIAVKPIPVGAAVGYGGTWIAPEDMRLGAAALGYGDGFPRAAPHGAVLRVAGQDAPLVGRVSMDTVTLDLRAVHGVRSGDDVDAWGPENPIEWLADGSRTIAYELFCQVASRVPRVAV